MSVTIELPEFVEQAFAQAARNQGLSMDQFLRNLLLSHAQNETTPAPAEAKWVEQNGIPMLELELPPSSLRTPDPIEQMRWERDLANMGLRVE